MVSLIVNLAMFFLVPFILLPCFVIIAMSVRGMVHRHQEHKPAGLENRRARDLTGLAAINTSLKSCPQTPGITRGETVRGLPANLTLQQST